MSVSLRKSSFLIYRIPLYGEWYDFHDPSSLMSPSPSLTFKVSFCLVCRVHQSHHNYTGPPHCMAVFSQRFYHFLIFFKALRGRLQCSPKSFQMVTGFKRTVHLIRVAHRSKNIVIFRFVSKLNKSLGKTVITASHTHTKVPTRFVCHVLSTYPLHHVPLVARSSPVWCYQIAGQYTPVWRQQFKGIIK